MSDRKEFQSKNFPQSDLDKLVGILQQADLDTIQKTLPFIFQAFFKIGQDLLFQNFDHRFGPEIVLKQWIGYIEEIKDAIQFPDNQLQFVSITIWDLIGLQVGLSFIEQLETSSEQAVKLQDSLLDEGQQQELADFIEELHLLLPDDQIEELLKDIDVTQIIPHEVLETKISQLFAAQNTHLIETLKLHGYQQFDATGVVLFISLDTVMQDLLAEKWAKIGVNPYHYTLMNAG